MFKKFTSFLVLVSFIFTCICMPSPVFAEAQTGTIKIFSEVKGIEIFIDEQSKGIDVIEITGLEPGQHYVKAVKKEVVIFSELVKVTSGITSTILIKSDEKVQKKILESLSKEQQQYKQNRLDILLSKKIQTVGSSYTSSTYYPGYYSLFGSGWTSSSSIAYETTDWKIIKGGVEEISEYQFALLVKDQITIDRYKKAWENYNNNVNTGAVFLLSGLVVGIAGFFVPGEAGALTITAGIVAGVIGFAMMDTASTPSGHLMNPSDAAKKAYDYNQALKKKLGLPENYEPK